MRMRAQKSFLMVSVLFMQFKAVENEAKGGKARSQKREQSMREWSRKGDERNVIQLPTSMKGQEEECVLNKNGIGRSAKLGDFSPP